MAVRSKAATAARRWVYSGLAAAIVLGAAGAATILRWNRPELSNEGCRAFHGMATNATKGEGGHRVGAGFNKGDTLVIDINHAPGATTASADLLQYASPDGPTAALTKWTSESFIYTVPASTRDFIYLNFSSVEPGMAVSWCCAPATNQRACDPKSAGTVYKTPPQ